jgi:hypothetical protein
MPAERVSMRQAREIIRLKFFNQPADARDRAAAYRPIWAALAERRLLTSMPSCLSGGGP